MHLTSPPSAQHPLFSNVSQNSVRNSHHELTEFFLKQMAALSFSYGPLDFASNHELLAAADLQEAYYAALPAILSQMKAKHEFHQSRDIDSPIPAFHNSATWSQNSKLDSTYNSDKQSKNDYKTRKRGSSNSVSLNKQIMGIQTVQELLGLVKDKGSLFDFFNISSAIAKVPKLVGLEHSPTADVHLDAKARCLMDELASLMATNIKTFDARGLANAAWAFGKLKYTPSHTLPSMIAHEAVLRISEFSPQNLSNLLWSFVYMHHRDEKLMDAVAEEVQQKILLFKPQELSNIIWAFASLDFNQVNLVRTVAFHAKSMAKHFKEQELSNIIWAFGKLHFTEPHVYEVLLTETKKKLQHFLPQGISNVAWALATVSIKDEELFDMIVKHYQHNLSGFDVQALSNLAWSVATLGYSCPTLMSGIVDQALERIERLSPQNLANILWACAVLGFNDQRMLPAWSQQVTSKLHAFEAQGLSSIIFAFAKLGYHEAELYDALAQAALHKLPSFTNHGLSQVVWAFAAAQHQHSVLFDTVAQQVVSAPSDPGAQACTAMLWAFTSMRHYSPSLFSVLLQHLAHPAHTCDVQQITDILWSCARFKIPLGSAEKPLLTAALMLLSEMSQNNLCKCFWAMAVLDLLNLEIFGLFCGLLAKLQDVSLENMQKLYFGQMLFHSSLAKALCIPYCSINKEALPHLPEPLGSIAREMWLEQTSAAQLNRFQQQVLASLHAVGIPALARLFTDDGLFSIDIGFVIDNISVAIDLHGSNRYSSNPPFVPLGDLHAKRGLLADRGWELIGLSARDWSAMGSTIVERGKALVCLIAQQLGENLWLAACSPRSFSSSCGSTVTTPPAETPDALSSRQSGNSFSGSDIFCPLPRQTSILEAAIHAEAENSLIERQQLDQAELISHIVCMSICNQ